MMDVNTPRHSTQPAAVWTGPQKALAFALVLLGLGLTAIAFLQIYFTVTHLLRAVMGTWAWTVVASGEAAFTFLFLTGVLLALRKAPAGALRGLLMLALFAGSVLLNVYGSWGSLPAVAGHVLIVVTFFGCLLTGKSTLLRLLGGKVRADRITIGEWVAHPLHALRLSRWMVTWGEPSRERAHARYMALLFAIALVQADPKVGRQPFAWRRKLPVTLRYQLSTGLLPAAVTEAITSTDGDWQKAVAEHVAGELKVPSLRQPGGSSEGNAGGDSKGNRGGSDRRNGGGNGGGSKDRSDWPETADVQPAVLARRIKEAAARWEQSHNGKPLPALQLSAAIRVRMSRDTATSLLRQHCYPDGQQKPAAEGQR